MEQITIGMVGAGRATELHMAGYQKVYGMTLRYKTIMAKRAEQLLPARERYGFEIATYDYDDMLDDPEIDVIDICTPPYVHIEMTKQALAAGKHVICEKPLSGYFGVAGDEAPIGKTVAKTVMYDKLLDEMDDLKRCIEKSDRKFMYAENFIYAPAVQRAAEMLRAKKNRILFAKGEESLKGSSSHVAGEWCKAGGGTFMRTGSHPLSAILWLKQQEAMARGVEIGVKSVTADMAQLTPQLDEYDHRHIAAKPNDVEDFGTAVLEFSDNTRAVVIATDTLLGGSRNYVELYCNDAVINCKLTLSNLMETYFPDEAGLEQVSLSEMLPIKTGWNKPFISDEIIRGYTDEMQDFMDCIAFDKEPHSGFTLAYDTTKVIYAAYKAAYLGKRVTL